MLAIKENSLSVEAARKFVEEWFDGLYHNRQSEIIEERFDANGIVHGLGGEQMIGPKGFRAFYEPFVAAYPVIRIIIEDIVVMGGRVALRCLAQVENAQGQKGSLEGVAFITVRNGKMTEAWNSWDFMGLFTQMELLPEDAFVRGVQGKKIA